MKCIRPISCIENKIKNYGVIIYKLSSMYFIQKPVSHLPLRHDLTLSITTSTQLCCTLLHVLLVLLSLVVDNGVWTDSAGQSMWWHHFKISPRIIFCIILSVYVGNRPIEVPYAINQWLTHKAHLLSEQKLQLFSSTVLPLTKIKAPLDCCLRSY